MGLYERIEDLLYSKLPRGIANVLHDAFLDGELAADEILVWIREIPPKELKP